MSDNIDYDELDRAIAESQKQTAQKAKKTRSSSKTAAKAAASTPVAAQHVAVSSKTNPNLSSQNFPPRRRVYMDFIGKPRHQQSKEEPESTVRLKAAQKEEAPKRVARFATATPSMPSYRVANSHPVTRAQSIPTKPIVRNATPAPKPVEKPTQAKIVVPKPLARKVIPAKPVTTKTVAKAPVSSPAPKAEPTPKPNTNNTAIESAIKTIERGPTAPNANNYSLGVRSPYLRKDAKVEKRPLSGSASDYVHDDKVEKNVYPERTVKPAKKKHNKHIVKKNEKNNSSWYWPILVVAIVAAGGGLGYLLWWLLQNFA